MNRADYLDQPFEVSIETLALCNARCTFCPYPTLTRKGTVMQMALINRVIDEMAQFKRPFFFSPFKVNEPLLDVRVIEICETLQGYTDLSRLRLFTNGSPLTQEKMEAIAKLERVEHLWISLNSHVPEEYEKIMGLNFERTRVKLDILHAYIEEELFLHPVVVSKVVEDDRDANILFVQYCSNRWPLFKPVLIKRDGWLGFVEPSNPLVPHKNCSRWFELSIMATGKVSLCCMDGTGEYSIGDVNSQTLLEIYNAPGWRERRELSARRQHYSPCNRCTY